MGGITGNIQSQPSNNKAEDDEGGSERGRHGEGLAFKLWNFVVVDPDIPVLVLIHEEVRSEIPVRSKDQDGLTFVLGIFQSIDELLDGDTHEEDREECLE